MVSMKTIMIITGVAIGLTIGAFNFIAGLTWFGALAWGIMLYKYFIDPIGQATVENMFGKNFGVFLKLTQSRRAALVARPLKDPLVKDGNKAFTPAASDYFYLGNIPLVIQPEDDANAFNPYKEEEIEKEGEIAIKCGKCGEESEVIGKMKVKVPVVTTISSERLSGFFLRLEDWILGTLTAQSKMMIMIIAILVGVTVLLNIYSIFFAMPGQFGTLATSTQASISAATTQILNHTAIGAGYIKPA